MLSADGHALLVGQSAAEAHAGAPLCTPVRMSARLTRALSLADDDLQVQKQVRRPIRVVNHDGFRIATAEQTVLDLLEGAHLGHGAQRHHLESAVRLLRSGSSLTEKPLDPVELVRLVVRRGNVATQRRVAYLLWRLGHSDAAAKIPCPRVRRGRGIRLDATRPARGPIVSPWLITLNAPDGLDPNAEVTAALTVWARSEFGNSGRRLATILATGALFSAKHCQRARLRGVVAVIDQLVDLGFVSRAESGEVRAVEPFASATTELAIAGVSGKVLARKLAGIMATEENGEVRAAAALLLIRSGDARPAEALVTKNLASIVADARNLSVLAELSDALVSCSARPTLLMPLLERLGEYAAMAAVLRSERPVRQKRARWYFDRARIAWLLGRHHEALDLLDKARADTIRGSEVASGYELRVEIGLLNARISAARGDHANAAATLSDLIALAQTRGHDFDVGRCLHNLGTLEARRGRPEQARAAYLAALAAFANSGRAYPRFAGILQGNLALMALWMGRYDEATERAQNAEKTKLRAGTPAEIVNTRILAARIERARGRPLPAAGRMGPLVEAARDAGDRRLLAEVWLDFAEERARAGEIAEAEQATEYARTEVLALAGAEPILDGLVSFTSGLVQSLGPSPEGGLTRIELAVREFERLDATFYATRALRDAASAALMLGEHDVAMKHLRGVAHTAAERRFVLGEHAEHALLYVTGALSDDRRVSRSCRQILDELGDASVQHELLAAGREDLLERLEGHREERQGASPRARLSGPTGTRWLGPADTTRISRGVPHAVVVDVTRDELVLPDGTRVTMRRRRVLAPLLDQLGATPGAALDVQTLAARVWERRADASTIAAIKMNVSRLRQILSPLGPSVEALRVDGRLAYRLAPEVAVLTLDREGKAPSTSRS